MVIGWGDLGLGPPSGNRVGVKGPPGGAQCGPVEGRRGPKLLRPKQNKIWELQYSPAEEARMFYFPKPAELPQVTQTMFWSEQANGRCERFWDKMARECAYNMYVQT